MSTLNLVRVIPPATKTFAPAGILSVVLMLCSAVTSVANAQTASEFFAAGSQAFASGNYSLALENFERALEAGQQGPAIHYNIASSHYRLGNYSEAANEFSLIAERYPQMRDLAEYNLGLIYLRQDRETEARRLFQRVSQESDDSNLSALASRAIARIDRTELAGSRNTRWIGLFDVNIGHDDNVALIDESTLDIGQSVDSLFTEILAVVSGPISAQPGFRFDGTFYSIRYDDTDGFDQDVLRLHGAWHWRTGNWQLEAGPALNHTTLNGDGFETRIGADIRARRQLNEQSMLSLFFAHDETDGGSRFAFLDGSREQFGVSWDRYSEQGRLTLSYQLESNDRAAASVSPDRTRLSARYRHRLNERWASDARVSLRNSSFDSLASDRDDDRTEIYFGVTRTLVNNWQVSTSYRWMDNDSNVAPYTYESNRFSAGLNRNF